MTDTRIRLPDERDAITHRFLIGGKHKGYITVGFYPDGKPGEIFVKMAQQGSQVSGFADAFAISVSMLLQSGIPLETICNKFRSMRFKPSGLTDNRDIPFALSPIDYVVRWLEHRILGVKREAAAPDPVLPPPEPEPETKKKCCQRCSTTENAVYLINGQWLCNSCREGRKPNV